MKEKLKIDRLIVVEGKYDKIKLDSIIDATIITTDGFGIFKNKEKQAFLRRAAEAKGIITATDSDGAGLLIRNFLSGIIPKDRIAHVLIPPTVGKERRKISPSKEGTLGVEGIDADILRRLFLPFAESGKSRDNGGENTKKLTTARLYADGLIGADGSAERRVALAKALALPTNLSTSALIDAVNILGGENIYAAALKSTDERK